MTIDKQRDHKDDTADYIVDCDQPKCKRYLEFRNVTFRQLTDSIKTAGWQIRKVLKTWQHRCEEHHLP
jgi:hypothetical protein